MISKRDWWLGVILIVFALLVHATVPRYFPRYEFRQSQGLIWMSIDRWTGSAEMVRLRPGERYPPE